MQIAIIIGSSRDGRVTPELNRWLQTKLSDFTDKADFQVLDLNEYDIPMLHEAPWSPDRTLTDGAKQWLDALEAADGYIVLTPEYNHTIPAVLKNAIDYTHGQLMRKPVAIMSHGSNSGVRANEHLRQIFNSNIGAVTISATVTFFGNLSQAVSEDGSLNEGFEINDKKLDTLLADIVWYTGALKTAREA